jgi:replicative DNA helicase
MRDVAVGDKILGADGRPTTVVATSEIMLGRPCYEVAFSDGSIVVADGSHQWSTQDRRARRDGRPAAIRTTQQIAATLHAATADLRPNHSVPNPAPLQLPDRALPLAPYTFGAWLGAGHGGAPRIDSADPEVVWHIEADGYGVDPNGTLVRPTDSLTPPPDRSCAVCGGAAQAASGVDEQSARCDERCAAPGSVAGRLRVLGVLDNKHIPSTYLRSSEAQRRALLAGLLDTAGSVAGWGTCEYLSRSRRLAEDVRELVLSLGYPCTLAVKQRSTRYTLSFTAADDVFRVQSKALRHKVLVHGERHPARYIVDVRRIASVPVKCVSIDNADKLYLAGRTLIPTHNSTASMDFARHAAIRHNCASAIFSLEMSKIEIVMRLLSAEARVPLHILRSGQLSDDDWTKLARRMGEISEAPIFVDDTPSMNLMEIRAKARRLKQRHDLKLIVVDYLQLMTSAKRTESRQQEVADLSRGLKLLAKEVECPVIAVSQLNRGPEQRTDKRPQLSDLRESGSIEQDADVVILLHRDDYYDKESPRAGEADFIVAKHRNGPTDTVTVAAQLHLSRFVDMAIP